MMARIKLSTGGLQRDGTNALLPQKEREVIWRNARTTWWALTVDLYDKTKNICFINTQHWFGDCIASRLVHHLVFQKADNVSTISKKIMEFAMKIKD